MSILCINSNTWLLQQNGKSILKKCAGTVNMLGKILENFQREGLDINNPGLVSQLDANSIMSAIKNVLITEDPKKLKEDNSTYTITAIFDDGAASFPDYAELITNLKNLLPADVLNMRAYEFMGGDANKTVQPDPYSLGDVPVFQKG